MSETWTSRGTFLVLLALQQGPKHGYEISTYLKGRTAGFFSISFGALYPILHRLEKDGLVKGAWEDVGSAKRKKVYALTAKGRRALDGERDRYEATADAFAKLLGSKA